MTSSASFWRTSSKAVTSSRDVGWCEIFWLGGGTDWGVITVELSLACTSDDVIGEVRDDKDDVTDDNEDVIGDNDDVIDDNGVVEGVTIVAGCFCCWVFVCFFCLFFVCLFVCFCCLPLLSKKKIDIILLCLN